MLENRSWFEEKNDVLNFSCKVEHISSLLFQICDALEGNGQFLNNVHNIVSEIAEYNKDIRIFCEKNDYCCSIVIVLSEKEDYTKKNLDLILKLKDDLLKYEIIKFIKIIFV